MYTNCKYVVMNNEGKEQMFLFPASVVHKFVAARMKGKPVAAGFISKNVDGSLVCRGASESLQLKHRKDKDAILLKEMI
jgi:hypothetical protein